MPRSHSYDSGKIQCSHEGCTNSFSNHAWGRIKADGWFSTRDGLQNFCPEHLPSWVPPWRDRKKKQ